MHPAASVIFFTTMSGAGYGLLALAGTAAWAGLLPPERGLGFAVLGTALVLISAGLLSSTFHLGHPERAWRALSQWRSSWLSREGVAAVATYAPALALAYGWIVEERIWGSWALLAALGSALTVFCTGQIYASLKAVPRWHRPHVTPAYLLMALASGAVLLNAITALFGQAALHWSVLALIATALAFMLKLAYWAGFVTAAPVASAASATGLLGRGAVRPLDPPHETDNYLLREMGFRIGRKHAARLRRMSLLCGLLLTVALLAMQISFGALVAGPWAVLAVVTLGLGIALERWLFFAEAQHAVSLYYGAREV